jgi:hypothetical protein
VVMILQVPYNAGKLSSDITNSGLSSTTHLHIVILLIFALNFNISSTFISQSFRL